MSAPTATTPTTGPATMRRRRGRGPQRPRPRAVTAATRTSTADSTSPTAPARCSAASIGAAWSRVGAGGSSSRRRTPIDPRMTTHQQTHSVDVVESRRSRSRSSGAAAYAGRSHARAEPRSRSSATRGPVPVSSSSADRAPRRSARGSTAGTTPSSRRRPRAPPGVMPARPRRPAGEIASAAERPHRLGPLAQHCRAGSGQLVGLAPLVGRQCAHEPALLEAGQRAVQRARAQRDARRLAHVLGDAQPCLGPPARLPSTSTAGSATPTHHRDLPLLRGTIHRLTYRRHCPEGRMRPSNSRQVDRGGNDVGQRGQGIGGRQSPASRRPSGRRCPRRSRRRRLDPGHQLAQLAAGLLDRVLLALGAQRLELRARRRPGRR